ncbi:Uncharacterised protein [uncultured archaeon]|nr:Uncharacterised protein [uncultured archaeon]
MSAKHVVAGDPAAVGAQDSVLPASVSAGSPPFVKRVTGNADLMLSLEAILGPQDSVPAVESALARIGEDRVYALASRLPAVNPKGTRYPGNAKGSDMAEVTLFTTDPRLNPEKVLPVLQLKASAEPSTAEDKVEMRGVAYSLQHTPQAMKAWSSFLPKDASHEPDAIATRLERLTPTEWKVLRAVAEEGLHDSMGDVDLMGLLAEGVGVDSAASAAHIAHRAIAVLNNRARVTVDPAVGREIDNLATEGARLVAARSRLDEQHDASRAEFEVHFAQAFPGHINRPAVEAAAKRGVVPAEAKTNPLVLAEQLSIQDKRDLLAHLEEKGYSEAREVLLRSRAIVAPDDPESRLAYARSAIERIAESGRKVFVTHAPSAGRYKSDEMGWILAARYPRQGDQKTQEETAQQMTEYTKGQKKYTVQDVDQMEKVLLREMAGYTFLLPAGQK